MWPNGAPSAAELATYVLSGLGYVFIVAKAATSFRRTAAWLGPRAWKVLHVTGAYYLWLTFLKAFVTRAPADSFYWPFVGVLAAAMRRSGRRCRAELMGSESRR